MRTALQIAASRRNGRKSRGPKSGIGKVRARHNALSHGLNTINRTNPLYTRRIEDRATAICAGQAHPLLKEQAIIVAECDAILDAVAIEETKVMARLQNILVASVQNGGSTVGAQLPTRRMLVLQRYGRRAASRKRRALQCFIQTKRDLAELTAHQDFIFRE